MQYFSAIFLSSFYDNGLDFDKKKNCLISYKIAN